LPDETCDGRCHRDLTAPIDPARFAISEVDMALLMRAAREGPGEPNRDKADGS
jgi:hypothetical protein